MPANGGHFRATHLLHAFATRERKYSAGSQQSEKFELYADAETSFYEFPNSCNSATVHQAVEESKMPAPDTFGHSDSRLACSVVLLLFRILVFCFLLDHSFGKIL